MYKCQCNSLEESTIKKYKQIFEMTEKVRTLTENTYGVSNKLAQFITVQATIFLQQGLFIQAFQMIQKFLEKSNN